MKIERLSQDKIRIFLTFDDLLERGIHKDDMWREPPKLHELFLEMMEQAYTELGFDASGPLAVEVLAMPAQGMVIIITRGKVNESSEGGAEDEDELEDDIYDMEVTMEQSDVMMYAFKDFEDVIAAAGQLQASGLTEAGRLYAYKGKYILAIEPSDVEQARYNAVIALLAEYGEATSVTFAVLEEYGKIIMPDNAVREIGIHFRS